MFWRRAKLVGGVGFLSWVVRVVRRRRCDRRVGADVFGNKVCVFPVSAACTVAFERCIENNRRVEFRD